MDRYGQNLGSRTISCLQYGRRNTVAMVTAVAYQLRIEDLAVMGVWRPNA